MRGILCITQRPSKKAAGVWGVAFLPQGAHTTTVVQQPAFVPPKGTKVAVLREAVVFGWAMWARSCDMGKASVMTKRRRRLWRYTCTPPTKNNCEAPLGCERWAVRPEMAVRSAERKSLLLGCGRGEVVTQPYNCICSTFIYITSFR